MRPLATITALTLLTGAAMAETVNFDNDKPGALPARFLDDELESDLLLGELQEPGSQAPAVRRRRPPKVPADPWPRAPGDR